MNEQPYLDDATVRELRDVMGAEFGVLVDTFVADGERRLAAIRAALAAGNAGALREMAHSFKGASLNLGAGRLAGECLALESRARDGDLSASMQALVEDAETAFRATVALLRAR